MRKFIQKQLLELTDTIREGVELSVKKSDKPEISENILIGCYNAIESIEDSLFKNVSQNRFSEYNSLIDKIKDNLEILNDAIQNGDRINKLTKNVKSNFIKLTNMFKNENEIEIEVVFLPYKAAMWDSFDSIYLTAREDKHCNVICMPIPYFERNADMTFGKMCYEGAEYPDYVEITDWTKYDLSVHKPDIIYIHNAYDIDNFITSIHPMFYSDKLKKCTECLIYIPYFVLAEIEPNNQKEIDNISHLITLPGVLNADKVIVQSEKMREIYINELIKYTKIKDRKYWKDKILGTGSPKFDKVLKAKKEEQNIPEEWLKVIQKPDGSWKKIVFYNTSISALLKYNEVYIDKMKHVFDSFRENADDIALLWRPHPLLEATVASMRPQMQNEYKTLIEEYKANNVGIYDDTSNLERAIVISDAYYGDSSSVAYLFQSTSKPIMIQNMNY